MELWQIFLASGLGFVLGFWFGAWVQRQEEPKSESEISLNEKIAKKLMQGDL